MAGVSRRCTFPPQTAGASQFPQQRLVAAALVGGLILTLIMGPTPKTPTVVSTEQGTDYHIDINQAGWEEWVPLDGIGETLARRITAHRHEHGQYDTIESLQRVPGIGLRTIERLRPWLKVQRR